MTLMPPPKYGPSFREKRAGSDWSFTMTPLTICSMGKRSQTTTLDVKRPSFITTFLFSLGALPTVTPGVGEGSRRTPVYEHGRPDFETSRIPQLGSGETRDDPISPKLITSSGLIYQAGKSLMLMTPEANDGPPGPTGPDTKRTSSVVEQEGREIEKVRRRPTFNRTQTEK